MAGRRSVAADRSAQPRQRRNQFRQRIDLRIGAQLAARLVAIAVARADHGDAGGARCGNVIRAIADKGEAAAAAAPLRFEDRVRRGLGLALAHGIASDDRDEMIGEVERSEDLPREAFELIGHHHHRDIAFAQQRERFAGMRIGLCVDRVVVRVIGQHRLVELAEFVVGQAALLVHRALQHDLCAAADEVAGVVRRDGREAAEVQRVIDCSTKVAVGFEQRSVEIETDDGKGQVAHGSGGGGRFFKLQANGGKAPRMNMTRDFAAIVLAAGKGTRMKSDLHKVLHPIAGRPMLDHLLATVDALQPAKKVVVVGAGRDQLENALAGSAETCLQEPQLGTGHAVQQAEESLTDHSGDVLVLYGDVPFVKGETMQAMLDRLHAEDRPKVVVLGFEPDDPGHYGRVIADADGRIDKMVEFKDASEEERACRLCNSGVMAARSADMFELLRRVGNDNAQGEYYLVDIVNIANADGDSCAVVSADTPAEVTGINSRAELARAEAQWQELKREDAMTEGVTLTAPETVFFSWDTALAPDVTVEPHVVFGPGVSVASGARIRAFSHLEGARVGEGCSVGPYARLRPGAVMEKDSFVGNFVEMKQATLGEGAKASHLTYLGDAEVGAGANIGAGTITCNYDGYFKHKTVIGERAFIGSNSALIAPVRIGTDAIVAAGSAVSRDVGDGDLRMVRGEQVVKPGWADRFHDAMKKKKAADRR